MRTFPKRETPTVLKIKIGPELFVNDINRSASAFEQILLSYKLQTTFAPTGYPLMIPIISAIALSPGKLKTGFMNLLNNLPNSCIKLVLHNNSVATKKGNRVGTTDVAHNFNPFCAADKLDVENRTRLNVKSKNTTVKKYFLIEITKNRIIASIYIIYMQQNMKVEL